jgi:hypothetical protein
MCEYWEKKDLKLAAVADQHIEREKLLITKPTPALAQQQPTAVSSATPSAPDCKFDLCIVLAKHA